MSKQIFISVGAFLVGAYVQKKFDVCGKLKEFWDKAQESLKTKEEEPAVDDEE